MRKEQIQRKGLVKGWNNQVHLDHNRKNCRYKSWHTRKSRKSIHLEPANISDKLIVKEFKPGLKHSLDDQVIKEHWVLSCIIRKRAARTVEPLRKADSKHPVVLWPRRIMS